MLPSLDPFFVRALAAGIGLAIIAAPLGCIVVWRRMAYVGETLAQASLLGVALGLTLHLDLTFAIVLAALAAASLLNFFGQQKLLATDSLLGLMHHAALALAVVTIAMLRGPTVNLMEFLFGDVFAVSSTDLAWVYFGGLAVLIATVLLWRNMVRLSLDEDLAVAEGVPLHSSRLMFDWLLAITIAVAMKIVGILLVMAFLVVPAVAARPFATTPERMAIIAASVAIFAVMAGLTASMNFDIPGGPSIVLAMCTLAFLSLAAAVGRRE